ncbi:MFS general substrate transporter [Rozella allomycis CSF55]|uniref:MFS general substrate transporter n=1 Tax=Rozella allomycis (strain CSF55) TaxID=988480 RepID=A0A4P9YJA0_ROZAC|nr:MFS general substrate transporter [Rozella allomycis CSF55]
MKNSFKKWQMLALFGLLSASNSFQWNTFAPLTYVFQTHFGKSDILYINLFSLVYMIIYPFMMFPCLWTVENDRKIRSWFQRAKVYPVDASNSNGIKAGAFLNALGTFIRWYWSNEYNICLIGQCVSAIAQGFILGLPSKLASCWFPEKLQSLATSIAVNCNTMGVLLAFFITPLAISSNNQASDISRYFLVQFIFCCVIFALIVMFFESDSPFYAVEYIKRNYGVGSLIFKAMKNARFAALFVAYGINIGGLGFIGVGMIFILIAGNYLDRTKKYASACRWLYILAILSYTFYNIALEFLSFEYVVLAIIFLGGSLSAMMPSGFELAAKSFNDIDEATSSFLLNTSAQFFGIILIFSMGALDGICVYPPFNKAYSMQLANWITLFLLLQGALLQFFI